MQENKKLNMESNTATPYDDVHRTMINDCPKLIIPVVNEKLEVYTKEQVIDGYTKETIIDMSKKVLEHLAKKYSKVREGVGAVMGGKILDYPAKDALRQGREEGRAEERRQMLIEILEEKGEVSEELQKMIQEETNLEVLKQWSKLALKAGTLNQFEDEIVGK